MTRMKDVNHTNPQDPRNVFGELFRRGPTTVTDGGKPTGTSKGKEADVENGESTDERMKDVSHTAADEERNSNRVWSRGSADEVAEE